MGEILEAAGQGVAGQAQPLRLAKPNAGMGTLYRSQHELVFAFKRRTGRHRNHVQLG